MGMLDSIHHKAIHKANKLDNKTLSIIYIIYRNTQINKLLNVTINAVVN
jgi:hypothetical protein